MRVGVASIIQESNSFSLGRTAIDAFAVQGLYTSEDTLERLAGTNTEVAGARRGLADAGARAVGVMRAAGISGPALSAAALDELGGMLERELRRAGTLDGLVLSLHGAMAAEGRGAADAWLAALARSVLGPDAAIGISLDLHANVTQSLLDSADVVIGYRTYPHVDMADTGARVARMVVQTLVGELRPTIAMAKRRLLVPAETSQTTAGPMRELRRLADECERDRVVDASVFTVQPWLDVADLGFSAVVTADDDAEEAARVAERLAAAAWEMRDRFAVRLLSPRDAIAEARARGDRPVLISESADSPTAGAAGDSPAMIRALLDHGDGLVAYTTLRDSAAVAACASAGVGAMVRLPLGAGVDRRFHEPVEVEGEVVSLRDAPVVLEGPVWTGMELSLGRMAVIRRGTLSILATELGPYTFDPAVYRAMGLDPARADIVVVRSATIFRAGFADVASGPPLFLDVPGASTPRFERLPYVRAPRPLYPLDDADGAGTAAASAGEARFR